MLNPDSGRGSHKARLFASILEYTQTNYAALLEQILRLAPGEEVHFRKTTEHGDAYYMRIPVEGANGQAATVHINWFVVNGVDEVKLASA